MYQQHYYVPKESGTLTDTLVAFGLAKVLESVVEQATRKKNVVLQDVGSCFIVDAGASIQADWVEHLEPFEQIAYLISSKTPAPADLTGMVTRDVDKEWERFRQYTEQRKQLADHKVTGNDLEQALADLKPSADWTVVTYLGDYRMQAQGIHNSMVEQWQRTSDKYLTLNVRTILAMFAGLAVDREEIAAQWKKATKGDKLSDVVTASQLFNPHMGKGQNRAKANGLAMGNEDNFWLLDYLKAVGLWEAAAPRNSTNADLRKTYILAPQRIALNDHRAIFRRFREKLWNSTSIKLDILAALLYTDALLGYSIEEEKLDIFDDGPPQNLVAGMNVAAYQLLSQNSYTMMNLAFMGLPNWAAQLHSFADVRIFQAIIKEHIERINSIDEERSEGHTLLQHYRDFVSGHDLQRFYAFNVSYSSYLLSELERSHFYVKPFGEQNLERLFAMAEPKLTPILQNQGFRNIAKAIRRSTITLQYRGRKNTDYDIRYGLGQDLKRKSQYAYDFIQALVQCHLSFASLDGQVSSVSKLAEFP